MTKELRFKFSDEGIYLHHTLTEHPSTDNFSFQSHSHNMHEIYIFLSGDGDFVVEGSATHVERGTVIYIPSGQTHNLILRSDKLPYERIALLFTEKALNRDYEEVSEITGKECFTTSFNEEDISWLVHSFKIINTNAVTERDKRELSVGLINFAIFKLMGYAKNSIIQEKGSDDLVNQIIRYVHRHLSEPISLDSIEKALFRDKAYLGRKFKEVMGCGIWEYIIRKRIFIARQQLLLTGSISEAFATSGFNDYSSFYRKYKKFIGTSPMEDLKNHIGS